jgi:predicted transcriptional regulator
MGPARLGRVKSRAREMMAEMLLSEIRKEAGVSQEQLAEALDIRQPTLSRMEAQEDMQISTLRRIVEALGGQLEIIAHLPKGDVALGQFRPKRPRREAV